MKRPKLFDLSLCGSKIVLTNLPQREYLMKLKGSDPDYANYVMGKAVQGNLSLINSQNKKK